MSGSPVAALDGGAVPTEREVPDVTGWAGAGPMRVGNAADGQVQHDALGLFVEAVSVHVQCGGVLRPDVWNSVLAIADGISTALLDTEAETSSGVWELREPHLLISEDIGRWLALDRAVWLARGWRPLTRRRRWKQARAAVRARVLGALAAKWGPSPANSPRSQR
ncbi:MAG: glycoside hydrolase family 15 protein [Pseudonocardiaceae bacterium]